MAAGPTPNSGVPLLSVVTPAHNEEDYLEAAIVGLVRGLRRRPWPFEVLICENGSRDRTSEIAARLSRSVPEVRWLRLPEANYGLALRAGFLAARGDLVANFDVDLVNFGFLDRAMELAAAGDVDIVVGAKRGAGAEDARPLGRRAVTGGFSLLMHYGFGLRVSDTHGLKLLRRASLRGLVEICRSGADIFDTELVLRAERAGRRVVEIPVRIVEERPARTSIASRIPRTLAGLGRLRIELWRPGPVSVMRELTPAGTALSRGEVQLMPGSAVTPPPLDSTSRPAGQPASRRRDDPPLLASGRMDSGEQTPDDLAVRLRWPESQGGESTVPSSRPFTPPEAPPEPEPEEEDGPTLDEPAEPAYAAPEPPSYAPPPPTSSRSPVWDTPMMPPAPLPAEGPSLTASIGALVHGRSDPLMTALTTLAFRVDALSAAMTAFRTLINDRLSDQNDQMGRAYAGVGRDLDEYRRTQERNLAHVEEALHETEGALARVDRVTGQLAARIDASMTATADLGRRLHDTVGRQAQLHADHLSAVSASQTESFERLSAAVDRLTSQAVPVEQLVAAQEAATELLDRVLAGQAEVTTTLDTNLTRTRETLREQVGLISRDTTARADRLTKQIDRVATEWDRGARDDSEHLRGLIETLRADQVKGAGEVAELRAGIEGLAESVERARDEQAEVLTEGQAAQAARLEALTAAQADHAARLSEAQAEHAARVEALTAAQADHASRLTAAQAEHAARLEALTAAQADHAGQLTEAQTEHAARLEATVSELLGSFTEAQRESSPPAPDSKELEHLTATIEDLVSDRGNAAGGSEDVRRLESTVAQLVTEVEGLRRRIPLRARPQSAIDRATIDAVADAVVAKLSRPPAAQGRPGER